MPPLFVYGTLLPGSANPWSRLLWDAAEDLGPATLPGRLYHLGAYPAFLHASAEGQVVHGRLARLTRDSDLAHLDEYEGPEYERDLRTATFPDGSTVQVWIYVYQGPIDEARLIPDGRWPLQ